MNIVLQQEELAYETGESTGNRIEWIEEKQHFCHYFFNKRLSIKRTYQILR